MPFESSPPNTLPVRKAASTASATPSGSEGSIQPQGLNVDVGTPNNATGSVVVLSASGTFTWQFVATSTQNVYLIRGKDGPLYLQQINAAGQELTLVSSPPGSEEPQWLIQSTGASGSESSLISLSSNTKLSWSLNGSAEGADVVLTDVTGEGADGSPGAHGWIFVL